MLKLARSKQVQLAERADAAIRATLAGQAGAPRVLTLYEAVGATVSTALPQTADAWRAVLRPLGLRADVIAAFSFGGPIVALAENGAARCCHLGSMLIVVDDLASLATDRRAVLIRTQIQDEPTDPVQQQLYAEWPPFQFTDAAYREGWRDVRGPDAAPAGCLAEIDLLRSAPLWVLPGPAGSGRARSRGSLGSVLAAMIAGAGGRPAMIGGADAWSRTVEELLARTARATVSGLGPHQTFRSATTYKGACGTGLVVLENREGLPLAAAVANATARGEAPVEGPISLVHIVLRTAEPLDHVAGRA